MKKPAIRRSPARAKRSSATARALAKNTGARRGVGRVVAIRVRELESLRRELERRASPARPGRWNARPEEVERAVVKLVLTLAEFLRKLMERQAIRRMGEGSLTAAETESIGLALMRLEATLQKLAARFKLKPEELNFDLGPLGRLL